VASVRKRAWRNKRGQAKTGWVVDYIDQNGERQRKTFALKKAADAFRIQAEGEVRDNIHIPESDSISVAEAGANWIASTESEELEPTTIAQYRQHLKLHIEPFLGKTKLSRLTVPAIGDFEDKLRANGRSRVLTKYIIRSLGSLLANAQENGEIIRNPVHERRKKKGKRKGKQDKRGSNLKIGIDIPTPEEIKAILQAASGKDLVFLMVAVFTGLRASELRGLTWRDIDFKKAELTVSQRADRYRNIGAPKTEAAERVIPLPSPVVSALREWRLACPNGPLGLVFPNGSGNVEFHVNLLHRLYWPTQIAAGVVRKTVTANGEVSFAAKYSGLHSLRHFFASWCVNRKTDGGLELPPKLVQARLGHSSITVTMDTYGHLFPRGDDVAELTAASNFLLA
jgi:integrase